MYSYAQNDSYPGTGHTIDAVKKCLGTGQKKSKSRKSKDKEVTWLQGLLNLRKSTDVLNRFGNLVNYTEEKSLNNHVIVVMYSLFNGLNRWIVKNLRFQTRYNMPRFAIGHISKLLADSQNFCECLYLSANVSKEMVILADWWTTVKFVFLKSTLVEMWTK